MADGFVVEQRFRSGTKYWKYSCDKFSAEQNGLAVEVDGGVWRLDPVDFTTGDAKYTEWGPGKLTYDDLHVTFLKNNNTQGLYQLAHDIATGKNGSTNRFNCTLTFLDSAGKDQMSVNYLDCQIVSHSSNGFQSDDAGSAATETVVFRPHRGEVK
jgi:hypothetical protein